MENKNSLLTQYKLGAIELKNRIMMSAMTRTRCDPKTNIPNDLVKEYYTQRASAGVILTEASPASEIGNCHPGCCGIYNKEQMEGWKNMNDSVHSKGGKIILQIWHCGRAANSTLLGGKTPIAPSPIAIKLIENSTNLPYDIPKEMNKDDIAEVKAQFKASALLAKEAGFDGVQLHGANGLIDQFIRSGSNKRIDDYGGSPHNRCKLPLEVLDIVILLRNSISVFGADRVGIKLHPVGRLHDMFDENPLETYTYLLGELNTRKISFIEVMEPGEDNESKIYPDGKTQIECCYKVFKKLFSGVYVANNNLDFDKGNELITNGFADMCSFGRLYISNPDLVERWRNNWDLNKNIDYTTLKQGSEKGYTDYPFYKK